MGAAALSATSASDRIAASLGLAGPPRPEASASASAGRSLTVSADLAGHFVVHPALNGQRVRMLVDTGASSVALSHEDAARLGIWVEPRDFRGRSSTANGVVQTALVRIKEIRLGDITVRDVDAIVLPPRALGVSLLGMSFLRRLDSFEIAKGRLGLRGQA